MHYFLVEINKISTHDNFQNNLIENFQYHQYLKLLFKILKLENFI